MVNERRYGQVMDKNVGCDDGTARSLKQLEQKLAYFYQSNTIFKLLDSRTKSLFSRKFEKSGFLCSLACPGNCSSFRKFLIKIFTITGNGAFKALLHGGGRPKVGRVTRLSIQSLIWLPHLSCKLDQIKMTGYKRVTSSIWDPPPPCKQAFTCMFCFPNSDQSLTREFAFNLFMYYAYICSSAGRHLKETVLWGNITLLLYSWKFFPNSARSHWVLRGHMTSNNETVSRQNLWAGNITKTMTSEGKSALLPASVDRRPPLQRGLMNFQLQNFPLNNKSLKDWSLGKQFVLFPANLNVFWGSSSGNIEMLGKQNKLFLSGPVV